VFARGAILFLGTHTFLGPLGMSSNAISFSRNDYMIQVISLANLQSFNPKFSTWDKADAVVLS